MRISSLSSLLVFFALYSLLCAPVHATKVAPLANMDEAAKLMPDRVGEYYVAGPASRVALRLFGDISLEDLGVVSGAERTYDNGLFFVMLLKTRSDSQAYALLTEEARQSPSPQPVRPGYVGTAGFELSNGVSFF